MCQCCPDLPCEILTEAGGITGGKAGNRPFSRAVAVRQGIKVMDDSSLETSNVRVDGALRNLIKWKVSLLIARGLD